MVRNRRQFLQYMVTGTAGSLAIGLLFPTAGQSEKKVDLENLCSAFPYNSQCENYLPGGRAEDSEERPIDVPALLPNAKVGIPVLGNGLPRFAYWVIK